MDPMSLNGGILIAMAGDECVTIGSDLRLGVQMQTIQNDHKKVHKVGDQLYVGLAGLATDAQTVLQRLTFRTNLYQLRENRPLQPQILASMLSNLLYEHRFGPYFTEPVVAGLHPKTHEPFVCAMDLIGCISNPKDFAVSGAVADTLFGICENSWEPKMDQDALFETTAQCLLSALERDCQSGWGAVVYTIAKDSVTARTLKARHD